MNIFSIFEDRVREAVAALVAEGVFAGQPDLGRVVVEPPKDPSLGDFATNAAMVLVRETSLKPRELADRLAAHLRQAPGITGVEVAGPGFINIRAEVSNWYAVLRAVLELGADYGRGADKPGKVSVEYVSANPTGPMHVGHCRGAVVGDALASLLAFAGRDVTREYYTNDAGAQVEVLARSAYLRYREALGETVKIPEGLYPGDYLKPVGEHLAATYGRSLLDKPETDWLETVRTTAVDQMMALIREDLALLKVNHDVFFSERSLQTPIDIVGQTIEALRRKGDVYEGTLPRPKGDAEDWEEREQTLFRATAYGDDVDRPLKKSDGSYTYFASDIAYHKNKFDRGFAEMIDVWGADHGGYVKRMTSAVKAVTGGKGNLDVKISQLVKLMRDGQPVKMSKRSGDFVTLREVVEEVGSDAVRFMMLMRKSDATLDFDLAKVIEQSKDNPVFYVQYAHARCRSTFRSAAATRPLLGQPDWFLKTDVKALDDEGELLILRRLAQYPRLIEQAAQAHEAHRVSFYLYELASDFHAHWNRGKDLPHLRFIREEDEMVTLTRLALVRAVETVLASGLSLLGVGAPEEMR